MDSSFSHFPPPDSPLSRQRFYAHKAAEAYSEHHFWHMLWFELARDYNASIVSVAEFLRQLDSHHSGPPSRH
jgi:hypothetical protein